MSIKIRLAKTGKKNAHAFRIVVSQTRTKRNGAFLDIVGNFNPAISTKLVADREAIAAWVKKGAILTNPVKKMLDGKYTFVKYSPKTSKETEVKAEVAEE